MQKLVGRGHAHLKTKVNEMPSYHSYLRNKVLEAKKQKAIFIEFVCIKKPINRGVDRRRGLPNEF